MFHCKLALKKQRIVASRVDGKMAEIPAALHKKEWRQKQSCEFTEFWPGSSEHLVALITKKPD